MLPRVVMSGPDGPGRKPLLDMVGRDQAGFAVERDTMGGTIW